MDSVSASEADDPGSTPGTRTSFCQASYQMANKTNRSKNGYRKSTKFSRLVGETLCACQIVEEGLKLYLTGLDLRQERVLLKMAAQSSKKKVVYDDMPLGSLINCLRNKNPTSKLLTKLAAFRPERNFVAHAAFAQFYAPDKTSPNEVELCLRLENTREKGYSLWDEIHTSIRLHNDPKSIDQEMEAFRALFRATLTDTKSE